MLLDDITGSQAQCGINMSGYVGDLNVQQQEALRQLKARLVDVPKPEDSDHYYLRWLRARKFNVRKAEEMFREHLEYRKEYGADTILHSWTPPEVLHKFHARGLFGEDRDGHPVCYDFPGNYDLGGLHRSSTKEDILKLGCMTSEELLQTCRKLSQKKGRNIETATLILDCENISIRKHYYWPGLQIAREVFSLYEANYPETLKQVLVLKAPSVFPIFYNVVKYFIDEKTRNKIVVLSGENWQEELQKYIAPDQLPQALGGTRCEPDSWCTDYINPGYDIPPEYYLTNLTETSRDEMERVVVRRGSKHKIECQVEEHRSLLRWEFVSSDHDISFGVYHKPTGSNKEEVVPMKRRNSHVIPESGVHTCENIGTYVLKFDNTYSWTRSKEVFYSVQVFPPAVEVPPIHMARETRPDNSDEEYFECAADTEPMATGVSATAS